jgi:hypothetical protein
VAIEHFERPFTDGEREKIQRLIAGQRQELVALRAQKVPQDSGLLLGFVISLMIISVAILVVLGDERILFFAMTFAVLGLLFFWAGYSSWMYQRAQQAVVAQECLQRIVLDRLAQLEQSALLGKVCGVKVIVEAVVPVEAEEFCADFFGVGDNLWLFFFESVLDEYYSELVFEWYPRKGQAPNPRLALSEGNVLKPAGEFVWPSAPDVWPTGFAMSDGDLFALSLNELLTATPERLESARRGNLFSSPGR